MFRTTAAMVVWMGALLAPCAWSQDDFDDEDVEQEEAWGDVAESSDDEAEAYTDASDAEDSDADEATTEASEDLTDAEDGSEWAEAQEEEEDSEYSAGIEGEEVEEEEVEELTDVSGDEPVAIEERGPEPTTADTQRAATPAPRAVPGAAASGCEATAAANQTQLYVGNLPSSATDPVLRALFSEYGDVAQVVLITDRETGRSRGYGYVTYASTLGPSDAIQALDGSEMGGRKLKVSLVEARDGNGPNCSNRGGGSRRDRSW